jgi:hypothetical protein
MLVFSSRIRCENRNQHYTGTDPLPSKSYLQEMDEKMYSSETNSYLREIDEKRMNLPKVKEVISIYEQTNELADQRDNLK